MNQEILDVRLTVKRQSGKEEALPFLQEEAKENGRVYRFGNEAVTASFETDETDGCLTGRVKVSLKNEHFRENDNLAMQEPVLLSVAWKENPVRMTAMYLHRDWWTRPAFLEKWEEMPERTQCVYLDYGKTKGCMLLLSGSAYKANAQAGEAGRLTLCVTAYCGGMCSLDETVFVLAKKDTVTEAVHVSCAAAAKLQGALLKAEKEYPEMFDYLGWCSWDAFYTEINEEKVRAKAAELEEKKVPVRWLLLDDGWLSVHDGRLYDLKPETEKFPEGFAKMIADIKAKGCVEHVGVWHALGGYWGGIEPGSRAHAEQEKHLYQTRAGKLLPYPEAERGYGFYRDWYAYLRKEGIDFVKVDGQSAIKNYYGGELPVSEAARETHKALEGAAGAYMGGRLINCMGMAMENVLGRQGSAVSRNSDDFVPEKEDGFVEHMKQNAYNAPYHDEFYFCDWDMFWTFHADARKHALLRAVSGGPVYFSDRIGDTDAEAVKGLAYADGRLLRMDRAAQPSEDCMFSNPSQAGLLKLTNVADCGRNGLKGGAIAVYNISPGEGTIQVKAADIPELSAKTWCCYDWEKGTARLLEEKESFAVTLQAGECALYLFVPVMEETAVLGLADKFVSFHAIEDVKKTADGFTAVLRQGGTVAFYSEKEVQSCQINGQERLSELKKDGALYRIDCQEEGKLLLCVRCEAAGRDWV